MKGTLPPEGRELTGEGYADRRGSGGGIGQVGGIGDVDLGDGLGEVALVFSDEPVGAPTATAVAR